MARRLDGCHTDGVLIGSGWGLVSQIFDRTSADQVFLDDAPRLMQIDRAVPDVFGVHDDDRAVSALAETAGFIDANGLPQTAFADLLFHQTMNLERALAGTVVAMRADENMTFVLAQPVPRE